MGLFTQNGQDAQVGRDLLSYGLRRFNDICGNVYSVQAQLDESNLAKCCETFTGFSAQGFPSDPGPFKRLGGFCVLSQQWNPFNISATLPSVACDDFDLIWGPRLAVWMLPIMSAALVMDDSTPCIEELVLPTPHFQVEFIAYLRNMLFGSKQYGEACDELLFERTTSMGLLLESCAYSVPHTQRRINRRLHGSADGCMERISADPILADDWRFNDRNFLKMAGGIGLED